MNVLWIYAHPEQRSLNASLRDEGLRTLRAEGHRTRLSDLYAMGWNPVVSAEDFHPGDSHASHASHDERLLVAAASKRAYTQGTLSEDIRAEQSKLTWADAVIVQFPLWWMGMPAILKGWFDRVFVKGFAYGVKDGDGRVLRYGNGGLAGKRAMVAVTIGAPEPGFGPRGIHGELDEVLFPLQHGALWYSGMEVLPPLALYSADRAGEEEYERAAAELRERLLSLRRTAPIPFRHEDGGGYGPDLVLRPEVAPGAAGVRVHHA